MKPKQEFYTTDDAGREVGLIVVKMVKYPAGETVTLLRRGPDGRMTGGLQMMVDHLREEMEDELCGTITTTPVAEQRALVGKLSPEMNAYFN